jgi:hypothetical protein
MKLKLTFLMILAFIVASGSYAQKPTLPTTPAPPPSKPLPNPTPQPTTPIDYYGMGYKTGYNLVTQGNMTLWQNSLSAAAVSGNTPYYDGLLEGGYAAQQARKPIKPQISNYIVFTVTSVYFYYTDGSWTSSTYAVH